MQEETIYDYMSEEELLDWYYPGMPKEVREKYNLKVPTKEEYIQSTTPLERISDLYILGLNRRDRSLPKNTLTCFQKHLRSMQFYTGISFLGTMI